ncbi:MAG: hypothetical protein KF787_08940 [Phycisphaeraceae bacterium]|nr:hypothetical protein [Phycisphaeraceae bacterium]
MNTIRTLTLVLAVPTLALAVSMSACEKKAETPASQSRTSDGHTHKDGDGHDHEDGHDHGPRTELGSQQAAGLTIVAAREGGVTPGSEATFDIVVTGVARPAAVRVWVGAQDGKGSVKGKAEAEGDGWHAHAEVPKPLPAGSKLWVEVETPTGEKHVVGFDLKF